MSVRMIHLVFERFNMPGNEKVLALALADHAHDDGTNIFPGNERLAEKTSMSKRTVIRLLQRLVQIGWLIKTRNADSRRGMASVYCINPEWINSSKFVTELVGLGDNLSPKNEDTLGDNLSPINDDVLGDKNEHWVTNRAVLGDTAMSPQPSLTINTTIISAHARDESTENRPMRPEGRYAIRLIDLGVAVTSMHPTLCKWVADGVDLEFLVECVGIARQQKPLPEKIAPNYLDRVLQTQLAQRTKPKVDNSWMYDDAALEHKGRELGIATKPGESYGDYRRRVKRALDDASGDVAA